MLFIFYTLAIGNFCIFTPFAHAQITIKDVPLEQTEAWKKQKQNLRASTANPSPVRIFSIVHKNKSQTQHAYIRNELTKNYIPLSYNTQKKQYVKSRPLNLPDQTVLVPWQNIIHDASLSYDIPKALLAAMIKAESNFNPMAISSKGARGAMQIMPATGKHLGLTNFFDPRDNVHAGARYLSQLLKEFTKLHLALAAYNAGPQRVRDYKGIPPYKETQVYVKRVLQYYNQFNEQNLP